MSHIRSRISLLFFLFALALAQFPSHKQYYIDSNSQASENGQIDQPFHSLASAFAAIEKDVAQAGTNQPLEVIISVKESDTLVVSDSVKLTIDNLDRPSSTIKLNTYSSDPSTQNPGRATLQFKGAAAHLALSLKQTKLIIQDFHIRVELIEKPNNQELVLIEVPYGEATFVKCDFSNLRVDFKDASIPVFRLKDGRYLVKDCLFTDLSLSSPLFEVQEESKGLIKFELNDIRSVTTTNCALVKAVGLSSVDFVENKVQETNERLIQVNNVKHVIFNSNTFSDVKGETPLDFVSVTRVIVGDNQFNYETMNSEGHKGLLSFTNFNILFLMRNTLKGYSGSVSPIKVNVDKSYDSKTDSSVRIIGSTFTGNSLTVKDADAQGLALLNMKLANKIRVTVQDTIFDGNSIVDKREGTKNVLDAASTVYVNAEDSLLKVQNTTFSSNKASRTLRNFYSNAKEITVEGSSFTSNNQIKADGDDDVVFRSFLWFGETLTFEKDEFKDNYADEGGAIGIYQAKGVRVAESVFIANSVFTQNQAKSCGAIFNDVDSDKLSGINMKDNQFVNNKADDYNDYNTNPKVTTSPKLRIYMEVITDSKKQTYESDEFTLKNVLSGQPVDSRFRFYVAEYRHNEAEVAGKYITSLQISDETQIEGSDEVSLAEAFKNRETESSFKVNSFNMKAPVGSTNTIKVVMAKKDSPSEVLTFSFSVEMVKTEIKCSRGEYYLHKQRYCVKCPSGMYSFTDNECLECPEGADCSEGGDLVKIKPGYWRDVAQADVLTIFKCPDDGHCIGGLHNVCEQGYTGALCNTCDRGGYGKPRYRPSTPNTCKVCEPVTPIDVLGDFVTIFLPIAILLYTLNILVSTKDGSRNGETPKRKFSACLYTNLFFGYAQNMFILNTLGYIAMPSSILAIVNLFANPSFATFGKLTCYIDDTDDTFMTVLALFASVPVIKIVIVFIAVKFLAQHVSSTVRVTALSLIWLTFLEAPGLLDFVLRLFDCHDLGTSIHSRSNYGPQCNSQNFDNVRMYVLLPLVVLLAVANPLMIAYSLTKGSLRSDGSEEQKKLRVMVLAKSSDNIVKSERSWFYFCYAAFGRLGLLLFATSEAITVAGFIAVALYYVSLILTNRTRKVASFEGWRSSILSLDALFIAGNMATGSLINLVSQELRGYLVAALWAVNTGYLATVYGAKLLSGGKGNYNRLENQKRDPRSPVYDVSGQVEQDDEEGESKAEDVGY